MIRYRARWVLPISAPPIADGAVVADDHGRIVYVGAANGAPAAEERDLGDALLMPGLVNAHCHLELTAMRGFLEDLDFRSWILRLTTSKRAVLDRDALLDSARWGLLEGVRAGITTYADTCDSGVAFDAMLERGVRGIMYQEVFGPDPGQCDDSMAELRAKVAALRKRETPLVRVGISPHAPYTVSDALFESAGVFAREELLPIAIHVAEGELESRLVAHGDGPFADGLRKRGIAVHPRAASPAALLAQLGVLEAHPLLIHCVRVDDGDIASIAGARCGVAHCPASNAKLGHGVAPLLEMLEAGIAVGLGSDSVASNNTMNILEESRLAVLLQRARAGSFDALPAAQALELATLGGARAIGLDHRTGSLDVGKAADLAAFSLADIAPTTDPEAAAVFALAGRLASFVAVGGRPLVVDGIVLDADPTLGQRVQRLGESLAAWQRSPDRHIAMPAGSPFTVNR